MSLKLRDLIRQVRACKTAAEERAVIAKESAMIRTCIRDEKDQYRHRNVAKLLFMHMLGYPTHFGQLECLKLVASPHFPEKRIGYLGLLLLLSEEADVLMLVTNSLKNDLNSSNKFVVGLALCGIGNLGTPDMSRDLATEVEKHLKSPNPYLRKKACLSMSRCLVKVPEMVEDFTDKFITLLKDRSHGVLITVVQLMTQVMILELNQEEYDDNNYGPARTAFSKLVPALVKLQRNLLSSGYSPEHDVNGISDPFLQVQILTLLRLLGTNDQETSDEMSDILAQVTTNTETSKNAGNAILYECVKTIMSVESEESLRTLAINILGRFLLNRDNNIRYVALNTLAQVIAQDPTALQKHRSTIVDCLKDPDISIRQRALELVYHLVNSENVEVLTAELLNYLVICSGEHQSEICSRVLKVVDRFTPDDRWRIDTLITMLSIAGKQCKRDVRSATIAYISQSSEDIRSYAVHKLLKAIRDDDGSQTGLLIVGIWCIGEYGDLLLQPYSFTIPPKADENGNFTDAISITFEAISANFIVNSLETVVSRQNCPGIVTQPTLTAYAKLSTRLSNFTDVCKRLQELIKKFRIDQSVETQLRSCEYDILVRLSGSKEALARMPAVDLDVMQRNQKLVDSFVPERTKKENGIGAFQVNSTTSNTAESGLLDLDDIFGSAPALTSQGQLNNSQPQESTSKTSSAVQSDVDLLSDIFSVPPTPLPSSTTQPSVDLFSSQPATQYPAHSSSAVSNPLDMYAQPLAPSTSATSSTNIDIFGGQQQLPLATSVPSMVHAPAVSFSPIVANNNLMGTTVSSDVPMVPVLDKDGLLLEFECSKPDSASPEKSKIVAKFTNKSGAPIVGMNLQCAVPKFVAMEMEPPSSTTIPPSATISKVTQNVFVTNSMLGSKSLMMKVKLSFTVNGTKYEHMTTCSSFPSGF